VTNTKSHIDTVISPDDGHTVAQNIYRKEINIIRNTGQQVGFIYKTLSELFLISNLHHVLNIVFFLSGDFPASELYIGT